MMLISTVPKKMPWLPRRSHLNLLALALILPCLINTVNIDLLPRSAVVSLDPQTLPSRGNQAAICVIVSNEEYYLDEWLDYHIGIGFHHIFVYDNSNDLTDSNYDNNSNISSSSSSSSWLARRPRLHDKVTVISYPGQNKQGSAYQHCGRQHLLPDPTYRWVGFFDVDEYLVLHHPIYSRNVSSFLSHHCRDTCGSLSFNWQIHSWNDRLQYDPRPVTLRFRGKYNIDQHVKSVSHVRRVDWSVLPHPHYPFLKEGYTQIDTDGEEILSPQWQNLKFPSNAGLLYHHHTKSHKEYIGKRERGRATMEGEALRKSREELVDQARRRVGFHNVTSIDSSAWDTLKSIHAKYSFFESPNSLHFNTSNNAGTRNNATTIMNTTTTSHALCTLVKGDEAYIDEWVDYHLASGFANIYIFDTTPEHWFRQWGTERGSSKLVTVVHLPGNRTDVMFKAEAYAQCMEMYGSRHDSLAFLDVNDFVVLKKERSSDDLSLIDSLDNYLQSTSVCAYSIPRRFFGNGGQAVYDPLPVTKRFVYRIAEDDSYTGLLPPPSVIVMKTNISTSSMVSLQEDVLDYLTTHQWKSSVCPNNNEVTTTLPDDLYIHHYLRSTKECKKERQDGDSNVDELCVMEGTVYDSFVWDELQRLLPGYVNYNDFL